MQLLSPDSTHPHPTPPLAARQPTPGCVPRGTHLPLVLGEQLGAAEEVLIPGERDDGLWELPKVELQQGGHCVHICGAGMKGRQSESKAPGSCMTNAGPPLHRPWTVLGSGRGVCMLLWSQLQLPPTHKVGPRLPTSTGGGAPVRSVPELLEAPAWPNSSIPHHRLRIYLVSGPTYGVKKSALL